MKKRVGALPFKLTGLAASILISGMSVAQTTELAFSDMYVFGDSLSDTGNIAGLRYTDGNTAVENVAQSLGFDLTSSKDGGNNYAVGGNTSEEILCSVTSEDGCSIVGMPPAMKVDSFYQTTGGVADPDALYTIIGGGNDVQHVAAGSRSSTEVADNLISSAEALDDYGAQYIIMSNVPDVGATPGGEVYLGSDAEELTAAADSINSNLESEVRESSANVLLLDLNLLFKEVLADPGAFGFNISAEDVSNTCMVNGPVPCGDGSNTIVSDPDDSVFWDGLHPTSEMHEVASDQILQAVYAAAEIGMMPTMGYNHTQALTGATQAEINLRRWDQDAVGQVRFFGGTGASNVETDFGNEGRLNKEDNDSLFAFAGVSSQLTETTKAGLAILHANSKQNLNDSEYRLESIGVSGFIAGQHGKAFYNLTGAYTDLDFYDNKRTFSLGDTMVRTETGNTQGKVYGFTANAGFALYESDSIHIGPLLRADIYKVEVDGFSEDGLTSTTLYYEDQKQDIHIGSLGAFADMTVDKNKFNIEVLYSKDFKDDNNNVVYLGQKSLDAGTAYLPGYNASADMLSAEIQYERQLTEKLSINAGYEYSHAKDGAMT